MKPIRKLLVANRGEIAIRVFRTAHELGIRTVAVYSHEDRFALHRFKADEAYLIGRPGEPIRSYLDIPAIVDVARNCGAEAIHPGYGFLSENPDLARACAEAGVIFVGPRVDILENLGDKIAARRIAVAAGAPVLPGGSAPLTDAAQAAELADRLGYPVLLKAAKGGGGRGMRVVERPEELAAQLDSARRESQAAFGSGDVFLEKFIRRPRHIEVQLIGDRHGGLVHLFERDCSVQRRHQKVVELAPAINLDPAARDLICADAVKIGREVRYENAGTVEFLLDADTGRHYFIEVNPRIQVEHTVTEVVTGVDIVRTQILVAQGRPLADPEVGLGDQARISVRGFAIQCRVTTEDPENKFRPDYGRINTYRSSGGAGVRLDAGTAFSGAVVTPYYDSLLVKVTCWGPQFSHAAHRMERVLQEFRIRGVKTNIPFLLNLVLHPKFLAGECTTRFLDESPELFQFSARRDRATKLLQYLADVIVNGNPQVKGAKTAEVRRDPAPRPRVDLARTPPPGTRDRLRQLGPKAFADWVLRQDRLLITDTTLRDAHQSLLATRLRTYDMLGAADAYARHGAELFSLEMWGGATFDTTMRFLKECPWDRLVTLRERIPNVLFQMLFRASNALGYTNYPDNVVRAFVHEAASAGIDLFRIFDSLNWVPNMRVAIDAVLETGALCEAAICYTGDLLDPARPKYDLRYYVKLAEELARCGAHLIAIKDMAGLCKPYAAERLVRAIKESTGLPVHFHTHDTAGIQAASIVKAADAGCDIADAALAPLSGLTSQPNLNAVVEALRFTPRDTLLDRDALQELADYWDAVRQFYAPFETGMLAPTADVYDNEMPGGQYTNLFQQARALGLGRRWREICKIYADVNRLLGDIVKVTPSSKAVGDLALFLVTNGMSVDDVVSTAREVSYPESVIELVSGRMGQPAGGFPPDVQRKILRGQEPLSVRPGEALPPVDLAATADKVEAVIGRKPTARDVMSHLMYPKVFADFTADQEAYSDLSVLPTPVFFHGLQPNEETLVEIEPGKALIVRLLTVGEPHEDGTRTVFFELNGQPRNVTIAERGLKPLGESRRKADPSDPLDVGAPMPGMVSGVAVVAGDNVQSGQKLVTLEAMKMETTLYAERSGSISGVFVKPGSQVEAGDLLIRYGA